MIMASDEASGFIYEELVLDNSSAIANYWSRSWFWTSLKSYSSSEDHVPSTIASSLSWIMLTSDSSILTYSSTTAALSSSSYTWGGTSGGISLASSNS